MFSETTPLVLGKDTTHDGLDRPALLEVLDAPKAVDVDDRIRPAATTTDRAPIEAELTVVLGARPSERTETRSGRITAPVIAVLEPMPPSTSSAIPGQAPVLPTALLARPG